ncbi:ABC transporter permease [Ferviditalea candida]|uniref:ABC transporter permease subunit n=1 Tax=Ferviditalea candida TaxID=3108399 RepID=A0ABU5ZI49_9BACL|nr:ABC transporter permease subunit [Paenibacillaceae bacterium T2]
MKRKQWLTNSQFGFLTSVPILILVLGLLIYPMYVVIRLSFTNQKIVGSSYHFIGFENYRSFLTDPLFHTAVVNSLIWVIGNTIVQTLLGFMMALLLFYPLRKYKFALTLSIIPWIVPTAVMALIWRWMLDATNGVIGRIPVWLGLSDQATNLLGTPDSSMYTLILVNSWRWFPFIGIMIYAALQNIPRDVFEAANVEGASAWDEFRYIILPSISKILFGMGLLGLLFSFNVYDVIALVTPKGGAVDGTTTLPVLIQRFAFEYYSMSKAATASIYMVLLLIAVILIYYLAPGIFRSILYPFRAFARSSMYERIFSRTQGQVQMQAAGKLKPAAPLKRRFLGGKLSFSWIFVLLLVLIILGPFAWTLFNSLRLQSDISQGNGIHLTLQNYKEVFTKYNYWDYLKNSMMVSALTVMITTVLSVHTAYAINRYRFLGRGFIKNILLVAYLFPSIVLLVPLFQVMKSLGLIDNPWSLILINVALTTTFSTWLLDSYMRNIPVEIEEAAQVDGANRMHILYKFVIPLLAPGIGSVVMFTLITSWSEYLFAVSFIMDESHKTLPAGLAKILSSYDVNWPLRASAAIMAALPIVLFFIFLGRSLIKNATEGAVK